MNRKKKQRSKRRTQKYSWNDFESDTLKLVREIKKLARRKEKFNGIYGIQRGGLVLAVKLSNILDLPLIMGGVTEKTLVVDDVADTGSTLVPFRERGATIVTLFYKPWSKVVPDIWLRKTKHYIDFPWED